MGTPQFQQIPSGLSTEELANILAKTIKELTWLVTGNLDVANIKAKGITADKMRVSELSAIAANLGKVTAGIIIGALIKTADTSYPRMELSSDDNLLAAYKSATEWIKMVPNHSDNSSPSLLFRNGGITSSAISSTDGYFNISAAVGVSLSLLALGQSIEFNTDDVDMTNINYLKLYNWGDVKNHSGTTLQSVFNGFTSNISSINSDIGYLYDQVAGLDDRITALGG